MYLFISVGVNTGLGDSLGGCSRLLSREQRYSIGGQRGERPPLHQAAGPDHPEEHPGDQDPAWDPGREGEYIQ